jgi:hypothetical protein
VSVLPSGTVALRRRMVPVGPTGVGVDGASLPSPQPNAAKRQRNNAADVVERIDIDRILYAGTLAIHSHTETAWPSRISKWRWPPITASDSQSFPDHLSNNLFVNFSVAQCPSDCRFWVGWDWHQAELMQLNLVEVKAPSGIIEAGLNRLEPNSGSSYESLVNGGSLVMTLTLRVMMMVDID